MWNSVNIPKHAFISWLSVLDRLRTREKLRQAGICQDTACLLCDQGSDACSHLFFKWKFSSSVCQGIMRCLNIPSGTHANLYVHWKKWGRKFKSKKQQQIAYASLAAIVYHVWKTHNHALWKKVIMRPIVFIKLIQFVLCIRAKNWVSSNWWQR